MTGANSALLFLGNVADSRFDSNEVAASPARELVNVYGELARTTFDANSVETSYGLVALFADLEDVEVSENRFASTTGNAVYVGTNNGHSVAGLAIEDNDVLGSAASGIIVACDTAGAASVTDVVIRGNLLSDTAHYGVRIDTLQNGTGSVTGVSITGNHFRRNTFSPILAYSRTNPSAGVNEVSGLTVEDNFFEVEAEALTAGTFRLVDLRNVAGTNRIADNVFVLSGVLPPATTAVQAIGIRGSRTGSIELFNNTLDGGGVVSNGVTTIPVTGVLVQSREPSTGTIPATAEIRASCNRIRGFENGVTVRDGVAAAYGGLLPGTLVDFGASAIAGNSGWGVLSGPGEVLLARGSWCGDASGPQAPSNPTGLGDDVSGDVDFVPWLTREKLHGCPKAPKWKDKKK